MKKIYLAALLTSSYVTAFAMNSEDRNNNNPNSSNTQQVQKIKREKSSPYGNKPNPIYELADIMRILEIPLNYNANNSRSSHDLTQAYANLSKLDPHAYDFILDHCGDDIAIQNGLKPFNLKQKWAEYFIKECSQFKNKEILYSVIDICKRKMGEELPDPNIGETLLMLLPLFNDIATTQQVFEELLKIEEKLPNWEPNDIRNYRELLKNDAFELVLENANTFKAEKENFRNLLVTCSSGKSEFKTKEKLEEIFNKCKKTLNISGALACQVIYACIHGSHHNPKHDVDAFINLFYDLQNKGTLELILNAWCEQLSKTLDDSFEFEEEGESDSFMFTFINTCNNFVDLDTLKMILAKIKRLPIHETEVLIMFLKVCQSMPNKGELELFLESCDQESEENLVKQLNDIIKEFNIPLDE